MKILNQKSIYQEVYVKKKYANTPPKILRLASPLPHPDPTLMIRIGIIIKFWYSRDKYAYSNYI